MIAWDMLHSIDRINALTNSISDRLNMINELINTEYRDDKEMRVKLQSIFDDLCKANAVALEYKSYLESRLRSVVAD